MDRWIVVMEDCELERANEIRARDFDQHLDFLKANMKQIIFSCGLEDRAEGEPFNHGGLWVVEAETKTEVRALCERDPYFGLGLRKSIEIFRAYEGYI